MLLLVFSNSDYVSLHKISTTKKTNEQISSNNRRTSKRTDEQVRPYLRPLRVKSGIQLKKHISSNKRPSTYFISKLPGAALARGLRLKEGGAYFKVKGIITMKFQNFVIFSFQITMNNYPYYI